jgi:hypothetical protein
MAVRIEPFLSYVYEGKYMVESKMVAVGIVNSICDGQLFLPQADIIAREAFLGSKPHEWR